MTAARERIVALTDEDEARFWAQVMPTGFCWEWSGGLARGYGKFSVRHSTKLLAHRVAYSLLIGPPPPLLDHLCRNRKCVNPDHLVAKSNRQNVLAGFGPTARNAVKDSCDNGHEYTPDNTIVDRLGHRHCRACHQKSGRGYHARNRDERNRARRERKERA